MKHLFILHKLPTPYNDDFFRALHADKEIKLQVFHLWRGSERRPWKSELGTGYPNYYMQPKFGIDWYTLKLAWGNRDSLFMIGDWAHLPVIVLLLARIIRNAPVTLWADTPQEHLKRPWWKRLPRSLFLSWLLSKVDATFGSGKPAQRALLSMGAPPNKIIDLQFTVDLNRPRNVSKKPEMVNRAQHLRGTVGCVPNGIVFGMSGTLDLKKKAQDMGIKAFAKCCEKSNTPIGLLIAGTGQDQLELQALTEQLGISDKVSFLGWLEPDGMDTFYMSIDILLHPANYDPFPLVIIEAMSWAKPVIGTTTSGTIEQKVKDGINGFAVEPGDTKKMTSSMMKFLRTPELLKAASTAAHQTACEWPMARLVKIVKSRMKSSGAVL